MSNYVPINSGGTLHPSHVVLLGDSLFQLSRNLTLPLPACLQFASAGGPPGLNAPSTSHAGNQPLEYFNRIEHWGQCSAPPSEDTPLYPLLWDTEGYRSDGMNAPSSSSPTGSQLPFSTLQAHALSHDHRELFALAPNAYLPYVPPP